MSWDPEIYHKFQEERFAPFEDLMKLIEVKEGLKVVDLGCGTGELTLRLAQMLPGSDIVGIDSSPEMLAVAKTRERSGVRFEPGSIEAITGKWDLVFSNAAIQWVDNHSRLIPKLFSMLNPGGQIAVQLPSNHRHPTQSLIREIAREEPFREALGGWTRESPVLSITRYAELLHKSGGTDINVFEKVFAHVLPDAEAVADWLSGTALLPYFDRLPGRLHRPFLDTYITRLGELYPSDPVFYPFKRIFLSAARGCKKRS